MTVNEGILILLLKCTELNWQRVLMLEKYVQSYGGLSQEAGEKVRELLKEGSEE